MWQETWRCGISRVRKLNGVGSASPGCSSKWHQSIVRPSRRGGVPVLRRQPRRPSRFSASPSRMLGGSPLRPAEYCCSPQWMRPFRNVPVVMTTAPAKTVRPSRSLSPMTRGFQRLDFRRAEIDDFRLFDEQPRLRFKHLTHLHAILLLVALRARRPDCRAARSIEQAELNANRVGDLAHDAAESVHFPHEMAFGDAADGRVAGHLRDQVEVQGEKRRAQSHARRGHGGFATRMAGADNDYVVLFGECHLLTFLSRQILFYGNGTLVGEISELKSQSAPPARTSPRKGEARGSK